RGQPVFRDDGRQRFAGTRIVIDNQYMWHRVWKARKCWSWIRAACVLPESCERRKRPRAAIFKHTLA
ncbi:hypothetical protein SB781_37495, partial [Paraburkholderia sp. SIMBA_061]